MKSLVFLLMLGTILGLATAQQPKENLCSFSYTDMMTWNYPLCAGPTPSINMGLKSCRGTPTGPSSTIDDTTPGCSEFPDDLTVYKYCLHYGELYLCQ